MALENQSSYLKSLAAKLVKGTASEEEIKFLEAYYQQFENEPDILERKSQEELAALESAMFSTITDKFQRPPRVISIANRKWLAVAAILVGLVTLGTIVYLQLRQKPADEIVQQEQQQFPALAPGGNKATLTLGDGTVVMLDTTADGKVAKQGNTSISKSGDEIRYQSGGKTSVVMMNTITTPNGGQYKMVLSDGSKVWLNAASSLRFPTSFSGNTRTVEITGEAYFEVAHNAAMPFIVNAAGKSSVKVLGTHFNINAYADEPSLKTTLLEGKVEVKNTSGSQTLVLAPGEPSQLGSDGKIVRNKQVNIDKVVAWKDGLLRMNSASIASIMRQVSRWYNIEVEYKGQVPDIQISGTVPMNMTLDKLLSALQLSGVTVTLENNKLIISGEQ